MKKDVRSPKRFQPAERQGRQGAATADEMAVRVHGVLPLPMGIRKVDRHEGAGPMTWKGSKAA